VSTFSLQKHLINLLKIITVAALIKTGMPNHHHFNLHFVDQCHAFVFLNVAFILGDQFRFAFAIIQNSNSFTESNIEVYQIISLINFSLGSVLKYQVFFLQAIKF